MSTRPGVCRRLPTSLLPLAEVPPCGIWSLGPGGAGSDRACILGLLVLPCRCSDLSMKVAEASTRVISPASGFVTTTRCRTTEPITTRYDPPRITALNAGRPAPGCVYWLLDDTARRSSVKDAMRDQLVIYSSGTCRSQNLAPLDIIM